MKKTILTITSLLLLCLTASAQLTNGLIAHYKLDGNADDSGPNGYDGTASTGVMYGDDNLAQANSAGIFNSEYINVPNAPSLNITDKITVSAWVYFEKVNPVDNGFGSYGSIVLEKGEAKYNIHNYKIFTYASTSDSTKVYASFGINATDNNAYGVNSVNNNSFTKKQWHLLTGTYDGSTIKLYIDGSLVETTSLVGKTLKINTEPLRIGKTVSPGYPYPFYGKINDVRVYDRALSAGEVSQLYSITNSTHPVHNTLSVAVYPNPSSGLFNIELNTPNTDVNITDVTGKTVYTSHYSEAGTHNINLQGLTPGIYFVKVASEEGTKTKKIIIQ